MSRPLTLGLPLAEVTRRDVWTGEEIVESVHAGHLVVVGPGGGTGDGERVHAIGDPDARVFVRSAAKPLQTVACLDLLEDGGSALTDAEVAVSWGSHRGEPRHLEAVTALLERSGTAPEQLTCPPAAAAAAPGAEPTRLQHNCSGKHAMFALAARATGTPPDELLDPASTLQRYLLEEVAQRISVDAVGVDGCGAPAVAGSLVSLARAYAGLAGFPWARRVREAGFAHPLLVGGEGRVESALLAAGVVAKVGAEGVYGVGWTDGDGSPWGLAVKGTDGAQRGVATAIVTVLETLGVVPERTWRPRVPTGGGRPAGSIRATLAVHDLAGAVGRR